jgi:hypothetical protein
MLSEIGAPGNVNLPLKLNIPASDDDGARRAPPSGASTCARASPLLRGARPRAR